MRVWDQEPTACYIQARGRADDFIFLPLVHRNSASKHTADFISAFKKRHLLPFFPANNTTIVMPAGPFPMMATCLFYFLHAFDKGLSRHEAEISFSLLEMCIGSPLLPSTQCLSYCLSWPHTSELTTLKGLFSSSSRSACLRLAV